jgi:hypothetical protein
MLAQVVNGRVAEVRAEVALLSRNVRITARVFGSFQYGCHLYVSSNPHHDGLAGELVLRSVEVSEPKQVCNI